MTHRILPLVNLYSYYSLHDQALKRFRHPNIVVLYGYNVQLQAYDNFLVYEYASRGSLDKYLRDDDGRALLSGAHRRLDILYRIVQAVHFLHTGGCDGFKVMHRDLKPGNVCLTGNFSPKLIDCGVAKFVTIKLDGEAGGVDTTILESSHGTKFGTPLYMCPAYSHGEIDDYSEACDVYSIGVIMVEMVVGCLQGGASSRFESGGVK